MSVPTPRREAPTAELLREAIDETKQLAQIEIALAKDEVRDELRAAKRAAIALSAAAALAFEGLSLVLIALALTMGLGPGPVLAFGGALLVVGAGAAYVGVRRVRRVPRELLGRTRSRLKTDVQIVKEHLA